MSSSPEPNLQLAARRVLEFESIHSELQDRLDRAQTLVDCCLTTFGHEYSGRAELRRDLSNLEWALHGYGNMLHQLQNVCDRTMDEFGVALSHSSPIQHETPELLGIRHAIHHRGLMGLNVTPGNGGAGPQVLMPLGSIRSHGSWGNGNSNFETHFHRILDKDGKVILIEPILNESREKYENVVEEMVLALESEFGRKKLKEELSSGGLYD
jgi:hypothetical protein